MAVKESVTIQAADGTAARIALLTKAGRRKAKAEGKKARWKRRYLGSGQERLRVRVEFAEHLAGLRERGQLLDTVPAVVSLGARRLLAVRGWDHDWPPLPSAARLPGRWPGSVDLGVPERIVVRLDPALVERVRAACWYTSAPAMEQLRDWRDENPGIVFDGDALAEYAELSAQVVTPGDAWRDGLDLVLPLPPRPAPSALFRFGQQTDSPEAETSLFETR